MELLQRLSVAGLARRLALGGRRSLASEAGGKHVPYGESGAGFYSDNTKGCYDVMDRLSTSTLAAVERTLATRAARGAAAANEAFTVMDMGTADAGTSMNLMSDVLDAVRAAEPETQIVVVYEDQVRGGCRASTKSGAAGGVSARGGGGSECGGHIRNIAGNSRVGVDQRGACGRVREMGSTAKGPMT